MVMNRLAIEIPSDKTELTRLQACINAYSILIKLGYDYSEIDDVLDKFKDTDMLTEERTKVNFVVSKGIIKGYKDATLGLEKPISRSEALVIIDRLINIAPDMEVSKAYIMSDEYSVTGDIIKDIPYGTTYENFDSNIYANIGSTYEIFKFDGITKATKISNGYKVVVTSNNGKTEKTYKVDIMGNPNKDSKSDSSGDPEDPEEEGDILTGNGTGTVEDPYVLYYVEDLASIGTTNTAIDMFYGLDDNYILANSLDFDDPNSYRDSDGTDYGDLNGDGVTMPAIDECTSEDGWMPIGQYEDFTGSFDGNERTISNLFIHRIEAGDIGLFGVINTDLDIKDLSLLGVDVTGESYVGSLVGTANNVNISDCHSNGIVTGEDYVGGLIGDSDYLTIEDSSSAANVNGEDSVGGLIGECEDGLVIGSYATGNVTGSEDYTGGFIGYSGYSTISDSHAMGDVAGPYYVGGFIGYSYEDTISNVYAKGNVTGRLSLIHI